MKTEHRVINRVIKFRAWDGSKMHCKLQFIGNGNERGNAVMGEHCPLINPILLQFTGLVDKEGNEIYEGDIRRIEIEEDTGDRRFYLICYWIKEWRCFAWLNITNGEYEEYLNKGIEALDETMFFTYLCEDESDIEICGNIYQHPHLLPSTTTI